MGESEWERENEWMNGKIGNEVREGERGAAMEGGRVWVT